MLFAGLAWRRHRRGQPPWASIGGGKVLGVQVSGSGPVHLRDGGMGHVARGIGDGVLDREPVRCTGVAAG